MVAANMSSKSVDAGVGGTPDRVLGAGPAHEEIPSWALAVELSWPLGAIGSLALPNTRGNDLECRVPYRRPGRPSPGP